jgi:hypothetical protein
MWWACRSVAGVEVLAGASLKDFAARDRSTGRLPERYPTPRRLEVRLPETFFREQRTYPGTPPAADADKEAVVRTGRLLRWPAFPVRFPRPPLPHQAGRTLAISCEAVPPSSWPAGAQGGTSACSTGAALSFVSCIALFGSSFALRRSPLSALSGCIQPSNGCAGRNGMVLPLPNSPVQRPPSNPRLRTTCPGPCPEWT